MSNYSAVKDKSERDLLRRDRRYLVEAIIDMRERINDLQDWVKIADEKRRDKFAMAALQALPLSQNGTYQWADLAKAAYLLADAMLAERSKERE